MNALSITNSPQRSVCLFLIRRRLIEVVKDILYTIDVPLLRLLGGMVMQYIPDGFVFGTSFKPSRRSAQPIRTSLNSNTR